MLKTKAVSTIQHGVEEKENKCCFFSFDYMFDVMLLVCIYIHYEIYVVHIQDAIFFQLHMLCYSYFIMLCVRIITYRINVKSEQRKNIGLIELK